MSNNIQNLISDINEKISKIDNGVILAQEAEDFFAENIRNAKNIFGKDADEWRLLDRWENENGYNWHPVYKSGVYADEELKNKLTELKKKLEEITNVKPVVKTEENEYSFSPEQKYEAYRLLISIFKGAKKNVWIIDNYLGEVVFDFIDVIDKQVSIKIITDNKKPIFKRLYLAFKQKGNINIDAKINPISHNRYFVIDDKIIYSIDASVNTIGKKDFMMHRVIDKEQEVFEKIKKWWDDGKIINNN